MFESFFEWSDEQGLPFRSWADALQEKGIPPAALLVIALLLIAGIAFVFFNQGPSTGSVVVSASSFAGEPLPGVSVTLTDSGSFKASASTDASGKASFDQVPAGKVNVNVFSSSAVFSEPNFDLTVKAGQTSRKSVSASLQEAQGVSLVVDVQAADAPTLTLSDADGKVIDQVAKQTSFSFSVPKNSEYVVKAEQEGFTPDEQRVQVGESNRYVMLVPMKKDQATDARLHVRVVEAKVGGGPVANASVRVFQADALLRTAETSEDGSAPALDVPLGGSVRVVVSAEGFSEASEDVNVTRPDETVSVALSALPPAFSGVRVTVKDSAGNAVYSPLVRLYVGAKLAGESFPEEGIAIFNVSHSSSLAVSVYKAGFLPKYVPSIQKDQLVVLEDSDNQSTRVRVHVTDRRGTDASRVSVFLLDEKSKPLGLPVRLTGEDGVQVFDDVPLRVIQVVASDGVRSVSSGSVALDADSNETQVDLQFPPVSVGVKVSVVDHFSRNGLANAKVSWSNASCKTDSKGACSIAVLESEDAQFHVSADGYSSMDASPLPVYAGMPPLTFELTSSQVAQNVRLRFDGVFDVSGRKVHSLSPLSEYEARYAIVSPGVSFSKAEGEVALEGAAVLGGQGVGARVSKKGSAENRALPDVPPVDIGPDGFSQPSFEVTQGGSVWFVNQDNVTHFIVFDDGQSVTIPDGQNRSVVFNKVGGFSFKSMRNPELSGFVTVLAPAAVEVQEATGVLFEYGPFNGSRQFSLRFKTPSSGTVVLSHRSAFFTPVETLRSPAEGLTESARLSVSFSGTCTENVCVQWHFSYKGRKSSRLDLPWGQKASLVVNVFGLSSDGVLGVSSGTPAIVLLSGRSNSSVASLTPSAARIRADAGRSSAEFSFQAVRLSADAPLSINVSDGRSVLFETEAFVSVFSPGTPGLVVSVRPDRVEALSVSKLVFTVKDTLGQSVTGARVSVDDREAVESGNASGVYVVDEIEPDSLAPISFEVTKDGYRPFSGSIAVQPPEQAVDITPPALVISVDSKEPASASVQLSNRLADKLRASISVSLDAGGQITDVTLSTTSLSLAASGTASFDLKAAIKESVLEIAKKAGQLKEKVRGTVHVRVSGKGYSESFDVPFTVDAVFSQTAIDESWSVSPDALQFNLEPPKDKTQSVQMTVSNTGAYPMVFNVEQTLGLSIQPASLTLPPGSQDAFTIKAFLPREIDCFSEDLQKKGALTVYGSFQGLSSKKTASVNLDVSTASLACQPPNGYRLTLPVDVRMEFLANARSKSNPDGSTSVLLPTRELLWFGTGASVTPIDAQVPQGTAFVLDRRYVQALPEGGWTISFPLGVTLNLPSDADYQPFGASGQMLVTLDNAQIILPPGVQTPQAQGNARLSAAGVRVPPLQPVTFRRIPFNYDALQNLLPPDSVEIKLPTDAQFDLLPGTVERKNVQPKTPNAANSLSYLSKPQSDAHLQNLKAIQLPGGERLAFGDGAALDVQKGTLMLPSGTSLFVSRARVSAVKDLPIEEAFELRMPLSYALSVHGPSPKAFKTQDGRNALKLSDDAVVEASWTLSVSKQLSQNVLRVARDNALTYLKGAHARIPYDPASVAKCSFTYAPPDSVAFTLPTGTAVQKTAKGYEAILPACDDSARLVFSVSGGSGTAEVFHSPAVKKIVFSTDSEFTVGDASDAEEKSIRTSDAVELTACLKDAAGKDVADTLKEAKVSFAEKSVVSMPQRVLASFKENQADVDLGVLTPISFGSKSGSLTQLGSAKKITLHPNGQKIQAAMPPQYSGSGLLMPKGSSLSFLPVCEKGSGRLDVSITAEDVFAALDKDGKMGVLEITFSNKNPELFTQKKEICLFNSGKQSIILDAVTSEPAQAVSAEHKPIFQAIAGADSTDSKVPSERAYFSEPSAYGKRQRLAVEPSVEGQSNCRAFTLEFSLPPDVLWKDKCISASKVPPSMEGRYAFKFNDVNGEPVSESEKHRLPVKMIFDAKESDCQAYQDQKQFVDLNAVSVNYDTAELAGIAGGTGADKLYFKSAGHELFFAIVNNEEKPVRVKSISGAGAGLMTCTRVEGGSKTTFQLQTGAEIKPADVMLLSCVSNPGSQGKQGPYIIDFLGDSFNPTKTINVHVWNPGPSSSLYPYSPIGKAVPFFDPRTATPKQKGQMGLASYETLAFADAPSANAPPALTPSAAEAAAANPPEPEKSAAQKEAERKTEAQARTQAYQNLLDFRTCKKFFCTSGQAERAVYSFASTFRELVNQRINNNGQATELSGLSAFCQSLDSGKQFQKSTVLQLTEGALSGDDTLAQSLQWESQIKTQFFPEINQVVVQSSGSGRILFNGCGIYRLTARLDPACGIQGSSVSEWMGHMQVELNVEKLQECPVNLANAALLTADTPVSYAGNQLGTGSVIGAVKQVFSWNTLNAVGGLAQSAVNSGDKGKVAAMLESVGRLRQGVLGTYGSDANDKDALAVKMTYASAFGANAKDAKIKYCNKPGFEDKPCPAIPYENANFCWRTGGPVLTKLGLTVTGLALLQAIAAANPASVTATGGSSFLVGVRSFITNYRLITAASGCGAGAVAEYFQGRSVLSCRALEACTSSVLAGMVEMANPFFGGWKPLAAEAQLLRATSTTTLGSTLTGTAMRSAVGSFALQSIVGGATVAYLENLAGPDVTATPPVVPITLVLRQGLSPNKVYSGGVAARSYMINLMPGESYRKNIQAATSSFAAQGFFGAQGRRTTEQAVRAFYDAGNGKPENAFSNALFHGMALLSPDDKKAAAALIGSKDPAKVKQGYAMVSTNLIKENPVAARQFFVENLGLAGPASLQGDALTARLRSTFSALMQSPEFGPQTFEVLKGSTNKIPAGVLTRCSGNPAGCMAELDRLNYFQTAANQEYLLEQLTGEKSKFLIVTSEKGSGAKFLIHSSNAMRTNLMGEALEPLEKEAGVLLRTKLSLPDTAPDADVVTALGKRTAAQNKVLLDQLKKESRYLQLIQSADVGTGLAPAINDIVKTGKFPNAAGETGAAIVKRFEDGALSFTDLSDAFRRQGVEIGASFGGVASVTEVGANRLDSTGFLKGAKTPAQKAKALADLQLYDRDGKPAKLTPSLLADAEATLADQQAAARKLLNADGRARLARGASAFAAFLSAFLFNTDFRPVQIQVSADSSGSHVIAVHTEKGKPSAESICIKGASGLCESGNVISVSKLCGNSGTCFRLLQWPDGQSQAYGLVVGFNDDALVDPRFIGSIFLPEEAPLLPADLQLLKLPPGSSIDYAPLPAVGFKEYQPAAENPKVTARQVQIQAAQALIDQVNTDGFKNSLSDADRRSIIALANQAIAAFRAGKDAEGAAKLSAADQALTRLLSKGQTGGSKP
ncbi:carboxypeptidase regulatory-like domain-containing protein [Candidatus Micrarchaeota archaeon]|nr:carboxypeptidase regulatory-like domain-containing protein [Candidatus Micrarchaeota archaeon]